MGRAQLLLLLTAWTTHGGCLASSASGGRLSPLPGPEILVACVAPLTPAVQPPPSEPDIRPVPGGYLLTDAQMATIEADLGSCRFQRSELLSHRATVCAVLGERDAAFDLYRAAAFESVAAERERADRALRIGVVGAAGGVVGGALIGFVVGLAVGL